YLSEHFGARTGDDGRGYLKQSINAAKETRGILEASYGKTKDVQKSTEEITDRFMEGMPDGFMPRDIIAMVIGQMLKYIAAQNP
ncbi:MAG: hypothetical protein OEM61_06405, partial [Desulfobacteraceae bacterium]|nr:hypothetical protein [Desulfobacteraceae bacterium]